MKLFDCKHTRLWENPACPYINRLPSRAPLFSYPDEAAARRAGIDPADSPAVTMLNGEWKFLYLERPELVRDEFTAADFDASGWDNISVPGNWTRQGYDKPHYTNVQMPWPDQPPFVPSENPTGVYRRDFTLDTLAEDERIILHFGGVESCFFVFVNGVEIGMAKDSRTDSEFDITGCVHTGINRLAVIVIRWSDGSFVEDQDHWWMAGIYRDVYIRRVRNAHIRDCFARVSLADNYTTGVIDIKLEVNFSTPIHPQGYSATARIYDAAGKSLFPDGLPIDIEVNKGMAVGFAKIEIPGARLWSAEDPYLYRMTVTLNDPEGKCVEATGCRLGMRSVELRDSNILVNGKAIKFIGVNRHDHDPVTGKTVSLETMRRDVELMKQFNFNAVRTCHYPNDARFLDLCDEYGLYVIDEANIESHAYYDLLSDDTNWVQAMLDRVMRMAIRDKNHSSVIFWSLCNESGDGANFGALAGWLRRYDPSRVIHAEGSKYGFRGHYSSDWTERPIGADISDVVSGMYCNFDLIDRWLQNNHDHRPFLLCEYSHAMGNSNGALCRYFELFRREKRLQGGFIWDWVDQGLEKTDEKGRKYWAYGGDFGDRPNDFDFCINGMIWPDRKPHPAMYEHKQLAKPFAIHSALVMRGEFEIENYNYFTTLNELDFFWRIEVEGRVVASGQIDMPEVAPQSRRRFQVPVNIPEAAPGSESRLVIFARRREGTLYSPAGFEVGAVEFPWQVKSSGPALTLPGNELRRDGESVRCGASELRFSPDGVPASWRFNGTEIFAAAPAENLLRALTDNDSIRCFARTDDRKIGYRWLETYKLDRLAPVYHFQGVQTSPEGIRADSEAVLKLGNGAEIRVGRKLLFDERGVLNVELKFLVPEEADDLPRLGWTLTLAPGFETFTYFGRGPMENYIDRCAGALTSRYATTATDNYTPYIMPQECGNRTGVRWAALDNGSIGLLAVAEQTFECSALHFTPADLLAAYHTNELDPRPESFFYIDAAQRGLGTASCGEDTLREFRIHPGVHRLAFRLLAFDTGADPAELAGRIRNRG